MPVQATTSVGGVMVLWRGGFVAWWFCGVVRGFCGVVVLWCGKRVLVCGGFFWCNGIVMVLYSIKIPVVRVTGG